MYFTYEAYLWIGILSFYIYDSLKLVNHNEFFIKKGFREIDFTFPSDFFTFKNKIVFIHNLLLPHQSFYKFSYPDKTKNKNINQINNFNSYEKKLFFLKITSIIKFLLIIFIFPLGVYLSINDELILTSLALIYLLILIEFIFMFINYKRIKLSKKFIIYKLFNNLLCPPLSINLLKDISKDYQIKYPFLYFAKNKLNQYKYEKFSKLLKIRLQGQLENFIFEDSLRIKIKNLESKL